MSGECWHSGSKSNSLEYRWYLIKVANPFLRRKGSGKQKWDIKWKREKSVRLTNQCPFTFLYTAKCSAKTLPLNEREKIMAYSREIKATSRAIKADVSTPKLSPIRVVLLF